MPQHVIKVPLVHSPSLQRQEVSRSFDINPFSYALNTSRALDPNEFIDVTMLRLNIKHDDNNYINSEVKDVKFQMELKWRPFTGMTVSALGAYKETYTDTENIVTEYLTCAQAYRAMQDTIIRNKCSSGRTKTKPNTLPRTVLPVGVLQHEPAQDV